MGSLGFEALKYKQARLVYDAPATGLGPGTDAVKSGAYFLNTKYFKFETYTGRNFEALDLPEQSPDMDAVTKHIAFMGCLSLSNRALQGRLYLPAPEPPDGMPDLGRRRHPWRRRPISTENYVI
jgi:hypothetical protein